MKSLEELRAERDTIDTQIKEAEERECAEKESQVLEKIHSFSEEQIQFIFSLIPHSRSSCGDGRTCNGYSYVTNGWRCNRCMLEEILRGEHGGEFDFSFSVDIEKVSP